MRSRLSTFAMAGVGWLCAAAWSTWPIGAQGGQFMGSADDPAIGYMTARVSNVVDDLNQQLLDGTTALRFVAPPWRVHERGE